MTRNLTVIWPKATRCAQERERLELALRNGILDRCGSPENAHREYLRYKASHRAPGTDWGRIYAAAFQEATAPLTPSERRMVAPIIRFE